MQHITIQSGQSIWDIAAQVYGSVEGIYWLVEDNGLTLDSFIQSGQQLSVRADNITPQAAILAGYFTSQAISINNSDEVAFVGQVLTVQLLQLGNARDGLGGFAVVEVTGGSLPYRFAWQREGDSNFVYTAQNLSNAVPGMYALTVTDSIGAQVFLQVDILNRTTKKYLATRLGSLILTTHQQKIVVN